VITVRNADTKTIPDVAVTICNQTCTPGAGAQGEGTSVLAFAQRLDMPNLASVSRPVWIIDAGPCPAASVCQPGGPGGGVTAYSNTWALGALPSGQSVKFEWTVTAVKPGTHVVYYEVAAGLNGKARAVDVNGNQPHGAFTVHISKKPAQAYVSDSGQVVTSAH
jgi:hypothetical protein